MPDTSRSAQEEPQEVAPSATRGSVGEGVTVGEHLKTQIDQTIQVFEERLTVGKRRRSTGGVRIGTHTEAVEAIAEVELDRYRVEVTRVPVGRVVDEAPQARAEGDTTIVPVIEERFVMVKQLFLIEEVHIRHVLEREAVSEPVTLRRQRAVVERLDPQGRAAHDETTPEEGAALSAEGGHHGSVG